MAFEGYLIKDNVTGNADNSWMLASSYESTPNQREELKAIRDENTRNLIRKTAQGTKTAIRFSVMPCNLAGKKKIQKFFNDCTIDTKQRKIDIMYWNDEENKYKQGYFYIPDITFKIERITNNDIYYSSFEITLIEY